MSEEEKEFTYLEDFEVSEQTLAIQPYFSIDYQSKVYEQSGIYLVKKSASQLLKEACLQAGSSFKGRKDWVSYVVKKKYKLPLLISEKPCIVAFPTHSPESMDCAWIFANHHPVLKAECGDRTVVKLANGKKFSIKASLPSMQRSMRDCFTCMGYLEGRRMKGKQDE